MVVYDVKSMRERFSELDERANEPLGSYDDRTLGIGRFVSGSSPWERHLNGDELLYVTDGSVSIEVLEDDGSSTILEVGDGQLFVVPTGKWHQLTAVESVNIMFASPAEDGAERTREHPFNKP
jgi:mannose-6-phosphate isomerase-like protein (cupin superfamily)